MRYRQPDIQPDEDEELEARYHKLNNYRRLLMSFRMQICF